MQDVRYAECSRAPDYITNGYGFPMQTTSCTWPYVVPIGEDPAAHGHWCTFTDLYHTMPYPTQRHVHLHPNEDKPLDPRTIQATSAHELQVSTVSMLT